MRRFLLCGFALCLVCAAPLSGVDTHCTLVEDQLERLSNEELGALFDIGHCEDQYSRSTPFHRP